MEHRCICCQIKFLPDRYHPNQRYCSRKQCQRKRRTSWQKNKVKTDADYRECQLEAQALWKAKNPQYWKKYRATHPAYVERNRIKQSHRHKGMSPALPQAQGSVAKMDFALLQQRLLSDNYHLTLQDSLGIAKMDVVIVQVSVM